MDGTDLGSVCQKLYKDGYDKGREEDKKEIIMLREQLNVALAELAAIKKERSNKIVS